MFQDTDAAPSHGAHVSAWLVAGLSLVLIAIVLIMAIVNHQRAERDMARILHEKGTALIRSLEAGTRTGMLGKFGQGIHIQTLLDETTALPDIFYIVLIDAKGRVQLAADPSGIAANALDVATIRNVLPKAPPGWEITGKGEERHFLVHETFQPLQTRHPHRLPRHHLRKSFHRMKGRRTDDCSDGFCRDLFEIAAPPLTILVGMDVRPFDTARHDDIRNALITGGVLVMVGLGAVFAMFWANSLQISRARLRDTRAMATEIVKNFPAGLMVMDREGRLQYANATANELLGNHLPTTTGKPAFPTLPDSITPFLSRMDKRFPETEISLVSPTRTIPVSISASEIQTEAGSIGTVLVLRDLSELRRLEKEVRRKEKLAAVGQLAAGVAHEVRNPLSSIKGFATHFRSLFPEKTPNHEAADILIREVNRLDRVIGELLEFARPSDIRTIPTSFSEILHHSLRLVKADAERINVTITPRMQPLPPVHMDPDRITQVLLNLYLNALQAMPEGGELLITAQADTNSVTLAIEDTGCGIPKEEMAHIFDPFYTTKSKGTGLGLAVVAKIMEAHGGGVSVTARETGGTIFTLTFPVFATQNGEENK